MTGSPSTAWRTTHGTPVYVHAKVCVIDDEWATVGSDNLNLRSWTHDSELSCAIVDDAGQVPARPAPGNCAASTWTGTRATTPTCATPRPWRRRSRPRPRPWTPGTPGAGRATRPPGRLRTYQPPSVPAWARLPASALYKWICDPDGRPAALRRAGTF